MPSTFTDELSLEKQATGENNNTWGSKLNDLFDKLDDAIAARLAKSVAGGSDVTLTAGEALHAFHEYTGTLTASINVIVPASDKIYLVYNNTSGAFTLTVKTSAGTGITVPQGTKAILYCDGTNVLKVLATTAFIDTLLDAASATAARATLGAAPNYFAPAAQSTPNMTIQLAAGRIFNTFTNTVVDVAAQNTATLTAPTTNPRNDIVYVGSQSGTGGVQAGTEAASPADPTLPEKSLPVARIRLTVGMTEITSADIDDYRELGLLGARDAGEVSGDLVTQDENIVYMYSNDADTGLVEPAFYMDRERASEAAFNPLGGIFFRGNNSTPALVTYADYYARCIDPTAGAEYGGHRWRTRRNGSISTVMRAQNGLMVGDLTPDDKGHGTVNAEVGLYARDAPATVRMYQFVDAADVTIASAVPAGTLWSAAQTIVIPTKGILAYIPTFRVDNSHAATHDYSVGLNINGTDYYPKAVEGATTIYQQSLLNLNASTVGDALGISNGVQAVSLHLLDIEALGIPTGSQSVRPIIGTDATGATQTLKGTTLTSRLILAVFDLD